MKQIKNTIPQASKGILAVFNKSVNFFNFLRHSEFVGWGFYPNVPTCHSEHSEKSFEMLRLKPQHDVSWIAALASLVRNGRKKAFGFTLAEVLVVLGIIGVVAMMTVPTVIKKVEEIELKSAFKKAYSNYTNAYNSAIADNGGLPSLCYYSSSSSSSTDCLFSFNNLKTKLKVAKLYIGPVDGVNIPNYTASDSANFKGTVLNSGCSGSKEGVKNNNRPVWTLPDGSMFIGPNASLNAPVFIIDTNGMKKPNKWGYDLFFLNFYQNAGKNVIITDNICGVVETGGRRVQDWLLD